MESVVRAAKSWRHLVSLPTVRPTALHCQPGCTRLLITSASNMPTTDATFRYRTFSWETSNAERHEYEYVVAQQPAGGGTARDALAAVEERLPRPPSGWSLVLIPSVSLICSGKEEMRPLATLLSQRGHRCYVLEWPGWTKDVQVNWALEHLKVEELVAEYTDFWCQALEHVAAGEVAECQSEAERGEKVTRPRLCVVGAGHSAIYAFKALEALSAWEEATATPASSSTQPAGEAPSEGSLYKAISLYESLVLLAPSWQTVRRGWLARLEPPRAAEWLAGLLTHDSRFGKWFRESHMSQRSLRRHFKHLGTPEAERLEPIAAWLFQRPRPLLQTDAAALHGLLDPVKESSAATLAAGLRELASKLLRHGVLVISPKTSLSPGPLSGSGQGASRALADALSELDENAAVQISQLGSNSLLPHEESPSQVQWVLDSWLERNAESPG